MKKIAAFAAFLGLILIGCSSGPKAPYGDITPDQFSAILADLDDEVLLDVRTPDETSGGIIAGARTLDFFDDNFKSELEKLDKDKTIMVYCAAGGRSGETVSELHKLGFEKVYNLIGGFNGWKAGNYPVK